jgi:hypothetical protein
MNGDQEPPPLFRTWRRLYTAVALYLAAVIVIFTVFTRVFNR